MALFAKKTTIPAQDEALPGRNTPLPISGKHFVNGSNIKQPASAGLEEAVFGLGCFWGAERKFWRASRAWLPPPWATPAATRPTRIMKRCAPAAPATPKWCA